MLKKKKPVSDLNCLNCETQFDGWFCPNCGQKAHTKRLTITQVISDFMNALTDSKQGFLKTFIDLCQSPAVMLNNYMAGRRKRYMSAAKYTFLLVVLFTVNISMLEHHYKFFKTVTNKLETLATHFDEDVSKESKEKVKSGKYKDSVGVIKLDNTDDVLLKFSMFGITVDKVTSERKLLNFVKLLLPEYHRSLFNFLKFFLVMWVPIFSFFSFILFRKAGFNLAEHLTINAYIYAQLLLIFVIFSPAYWLAPGLSITTLNITLWASTFYLFFSYIQVFGKGRFLIFRTSFSLLSAYTSYIVLLSILMAAQIVYVGLLNIDRLQ